MRQKIIRRYRGTDIQDSKKRLESCSNRFFMRSMFCYIIDLEENRD